MSRSGLPIFGLDALKSVLPRDAVMAAVADAFVRHARGDVISPPPGQLLFDAPPGDCHIKYGCFRGGPIFAIKVAMGFYENPSKGLATNNGLVLVFDAATGKTRAILDDEGWLTSWRTAAAGALAARAGAPRRVTRLGLVGAGHQAELQARWTSAALGLDRVAIWSKVGDRARRLADRLRDDGLDAEPVESVDALLERCNVVMTCTPSTRAIVPAAAVRPGTHLVAIGADSPGKQELDPRIFAKAAVIVTDDHAQCLDHGDYHYAVRDGLVRETADIPLGRVLAGDASARLSDDEITVVDLTGLPAQDIAMATLAIERLGLASPTTLPL